jgi:hypothetical protein
MLIYTSALCTLHVGLLPHGDWDPQSTYEPASLDAFKQCIKAQAQVILPQGYAKSGSMDRPVIISDVLTTLSLRWLLLKQLSYSQGGNRS